MKKLLKGLLIASLVLVFVSVLAACQQAEETPAPAPVDVATAEPCPVAAPCPDLSADIPFYALWMDSGHADSTAEAFRHWDEESPKEVPTGCAKCHSSPGFLDYVGADGTAINVVDAPASTETVISCNTCHNEATAGYSSVVFPSGAEVTGLGREAVCMTCHQGRASVVQVDGAIAKSGATDDDTVVAELGFTNIHYFAAAVSRYGTQVKGGYEYAGKTYDVMFDHVVGVQACQDCHNPHSLELEVNKCVGCHTGVTGGESVKNIRMQSSMVDYDGDGDVEEGIAFEIEGLQTMLLSAIQAYASEVAGTPIVYSATAYPYFFIDANADGVVDDGDTERYASWTPRLAKAAYNYQTSIKDPGAFAHGGKYIIELLYDSIEDLNTKLATPVDLTAAHREDAGHFAGSTEAFRHWDEDGAVPASCAKCHTGMGLPTFLAEGAVLSVEPSNGMMCETCHDSVSEFTRYQVETVTFPSGAKLGFEDTPDANLCLNCHQGRESTVSVNKVVAGIGLDVVSEKVSFRNVHYFAAGASIFGTEAKGAYEFDGKEYAGQFQHVDGYATCVDCHDTHGLTVNTGACKGCHQVDEPALIRFEDPAVDYDGDGDTTEGIKGEIDTLVEKLYVEIQAYATAKAGTPLVYNPHAYPYFFIDANADGLADEGDTERYVTWTPRLLFSAYNYQYAQKDPGGFAHNGQYLIQVLYDSIQSLNPAAVGELTRP
ncbi:MAG: cytochrome c3 family protein [Bellilinea sp.]